MPFLSGENEITRLIEQRKWDAVLKILIRKEGQKLLNRVKTHGFSILHFALDYDPPLELVEHMLRINASLRFYVDQNGVLPIHVACSNGCDAEMIELLIEQERKGYSEIACATDRNLRTPLHYMCHHIMYPRIRFIRNRFVNASTSVSSSSKGGESRSAYRNWFERKGSSVEADPDVDFSMDESSSDVQDDLSISLDKFTNLHAAIQALTTASPHTVHSTDIDGKSPADLLHDFKAEFDYESARWERCDIICDYLREVSKTIYIKNRRKWEIEAADKQLKKTGDTTLPTIESTSNSTDLEIVDS